MIPPGFFVTKWRRLTPLLHPQGSNGVDPHRGERWPKPRERPGQQEDGHDDAMDSQVGLGHVEQQESQRATEERAEDQPSPAST